MRVAIIGTGGIGSALATLFARNGHEVILGTRSVEKATLLARQIGGADPSSYRAAAESADIVFFCVLWEHKDGALDQLGDLSGKIVVDVSNPETVDGRSLVLGHSISGAEIIAARADGARIVKAFNYIYAELLRAPQKSGRLNPSIFLCGDDDAARKIVSSLIASCQLQPVDCGPLRNARYLEPLALLMVHLVHEEGWPPDEIGMKLAQIQTGEPEMLLDNNLKEAM